MVRIAKRPGKPRPLSYSVFGFQGANAPPNIVDGVDGIHHSAISSQTVEVIRHLPDGVPKGIEGIRRHVGSRSVSRFASANSSNDTVKAVRAAATIAGAAGGRFDLVTAMGALANW